MKNKVKITIAFVIVISMAMIGWYFLRGSQIKKVEITGNEQLETERGAEDGNNSIAETPAVSVDSNPKGEMVTKIVDKSDSAAKPVVSSSKLKIVNKLLNSEFQIADGRKIDTIIIHSSYDATSNDPFNVSGIIQEYKDYGVSAHYLIGRDGAVYRLVEEKDIAYHAGVSSVPDGRTGVNAFSLGIELVNTKTDQMTSQQYMALRSLISDIKSRYEIKYVLGHDQIAPGRKDDPWNFDWKKIK